MENETGLKIFFWIVTAIMLFSVITVLLVMVLYNKRTYRMKQKESEILLKATLEAERQERKRIAADLHDDISGNLNALQNLVTILYDKQQDPFNKEILYETSSMLSNTLKSVQNISYNLMPPMLESYGLIPTLKSYFKRIEKLHTIEVIQKYQTEDMPISSSDAYELYRTIQELTTNMIKHGKSDRIILSVSSENKTLLFEICDNGHSFDFYRSSKETTGMGLKNIASRILNANAKLKQFPVEKGNKIQIFLDININRE